MTEEENCMPQEILLHDFTVLAGKMENALLLPDAKGEIYLSAPLPQGWSALETAAVCLRGDAQRRLRVRLGLAAGPEEKPLLEMHYHLLPCCRVQVPFPIGPKALAMDAAFLPPWPGVFKGGMGGRAVRAEEVSHITLCIAGDGLRAVALEKIAFVNGWQPQNVEGAPLVDALGQKKAGNWPGKTKDLDELKDYLMKELAWAQTYNRYPEGWSKWGGWLEKRFEATGFFHSVHDGRRWWLADPDGYAFFSNGMCYGNRTGIYGMADHLEQLHDWVPPREGLLSHARTTGDQIPQYVVRNGRGGAEKRELINFPRANMMRVFGEGWLDAWIAINAARMRAWGVNTIGVGVNDYGDEPTREFLQKAKIPYVITFKFFPLTQERIFRDFPDVFSEEYARLAAEMAVRELSAVKDDPYLIGYFVTNEPEWLFYADVNLCWQLLHKPGCVASRRRLIEFLQGRYGSVDALNAAWGTALPGWDALLSPLEKRPDTPAAQADFQAFHLQLVDAYGKIISEALKEVDPHHLNLGMRYAGAVGEQVKKIVSGPLNYFDVFSFNRYGAEPVTPARDVGREVNMPMMVGEWHIGAQEGGLDSWGIYYTDTQARRAQAIAYYLEQSTQEPHLTGVHYFEYGDQPYLGRFDGECYQIGLIDVCNRPYPLTAKAFADFAQRMYPLLDGREKPVHTRVEIHNIG